MNDAEKTPVDPGGQYARLLREVVAMRLELTNIRGDLRRNVLLVPAGMALLAIIIGVANYGLTQSVSKRVDRIEEAVNPDAGAPLARR